ncbi:MopE-related protein [Cesiribacter andamanensis]|uniref:Secretion system C-terminal sorting domain-containing protein n=1 Tax=Cesiribacter andamanensis AMV16 TaxID=1279009 RepID=M7MXC4_9BACT|nr:MopE-related protein [Cesiribacter andamanensis]EMR01088.1 hypothetical protein ADICEAN_03792 [Cesiribacter andamanensis AMV16]
MCFYFGAAVPGGGRGLYAYSAAAACIPTGAEIPGDGLDNNCNGEIDEEEPPFGLQPLPALVIGTEQEFEFILPLVHSQQHQLQEVSFLANRPAWLQAEVQATSIRLFGTTPARSWGRYFPELLATTAGGQQARQLLSIRIDNCQNRRWYADGDGDGYGSSEHSLLVCRQPEGYVTSPGDCNDADAALYPGATELADGLDNNCSGEIDEEGGCHATHVVSFRQGYRPDAGTIGQRRSNPQLALGAPQENSTYNFVSLGFGGELVLELGSLLYDDGSEAPDLMVVETSWGWASRPCYDDALAGMPETMMLEVSANGSQWVRVPGQFCRTVKIDLSPVVGAGKLPYVRYLRISDTSNPADFHPSSTGYDVDGIITCRSLFEPLQTNARLASGASVYKPDFFNELSDEEENTLRPLRYYPNPVTDKLRLQGGGLGVGPLELSLYTLTGQRVYQRTYPADSQRGILELSMEGLPKGLYVLRLQSGGQAGVLKIIKE